MSVRNMNRDIPQTSDGVRSKHRKSKYQRSKDHESKNHEFELPHGQITRPSENQRVGTQVMYPWSVIIVSF